jgi:putative transposase
MSRVVEGRFIFGTSGGGSVEAEFFVALMRGLEAYTGIRVLEYVLMGNHFHLLCEMPAPRPLSQSEILERIEAFYGSQRAEALRQQLARYAEQAFG